MSEYDILLADELESFVESLGSRKVRMFRDEVERLAANPIPESEHDNRQPFPVEGKNWYSFTIGRSWVVFYVVEEDATTVRVVDVQPMDEAIEHGLIAATRRPGK